MPMPCPEKAAVRRSRVSRFRQAPVSRRLPFPPRCESRETGAALAVRRSCAFSRRSCWSQMVQFRRELPGLAYGPGCINARPPVLSAWDTCSSAREGWRAVLPARDCSGRPAPMPAAGFPARHRPQRKAQNMLQARITSTRASSSPPYVRRYLLLLTILVIVPCGIDAIPNQSGTKREECADSVSAGAFRPWR